jgi:hypothetical protein
LPFVPTPPGVSARDRCDWYEVNDLNRKQASSYLTDIAPHLKDATKKKICDLIGTRLKHLKLFEGEVGCVAAAARCLSRAFIA